jgi:exodeoxyribonuclease-5
MEKKEGSPYKFTRVPKLVKKEEELLADIERQMGGQMAENTLSKEQREVFEAVVSWYERRGDSGVLTVGGYAGVGKSTLISVLAHHYRDESVAFCALTGKATSVLRKKFAEAGVVAFAHETSTLHSLLYRPITDSKTGALVEWKRRYDLDSYSLIVVDEASMLDKTLFDDLQAHGVPILAVGDHGQLPPITGNFNLMKNPDYKLETIHRQAADSPILALSALVRRTGQIPRFCADGHEVQVLPYDQLHDVVFSLFGHKGLRYDDVGLLVFTNRERIALNDLARTARWGKTVFSGPLVGDQVILLKNVEGHIFNGMRGIITHLDPAYETKYNYYGKVLFEDEEIEVEGPICRAQFGQPGTIKDFNDYLRLTGRRVHNWDSIGLLMDYGYAMTIHKAQGSSYEHVIVVNDVPRAMDFDTKKRALYTAITRASKYLVVLQ